MDRLTWFTFFLLSVGIILLICSKYRNPVIGYRTPRSFKSEGHWKYANRLSGFLVIFFGILWYAIHKITAIFTDILISGGQRAILLISGFTAIIVIVEIKLNGLDQPR